MSEESIKSVIQKARVCFKCLKPEHIAKNCGEQCSICGKGHHKVICQSKNNSQAETVTKAAGSVNSSTTAKEQVGKKNLRMHQEPDNEAVSHVFTAQSVGRQTILQTARVNIQGQNGVTYSNILFGTGSDQPLPDHVDEVVHCFNTVLRQRLDKHAPEKSVRVAQRLTQPWINEEIVNCKKDCRKLEKLWRKD